MVGMGLGIVSARIRSLGMADVNSGGTVMARIVWAGGLFDGGWLMRLI